MISRAGFLPNTYGFKGIWSNADVVGLSGVLASTESRFFFAIWDDERSSYVPYFEIPFDALVDVQTKTFGLSRRLLVRTNDHSVFTIEITARSGITVDQEGTDAWASFLVSKIKHPSM